MKYELMKLPYAYHALEPNMDAKTVEVHHSKHHQTYVNNLNAALEKHPELEGKTIEELLKDVNSIPADIRNTVINNGGGMVNHDLYWNCMKKDGGGEPTGEIAEAINNEFGNYENFKEKFSNVAKTHFASGWGWLVVNKGKLEVFSTSGHDTPLSVAKTPILVIDVWEHAYYLKHMNKRPEFIECFFNLINWDEVNKNYKKAIQH